MPDKYDEPNYGQNTANLRGAMGAGGGQYTEVPSMVTLFSGRTGIQMVEETLAQYGNATNAPDWLKPQFDKLESMFGESSAGSGVMLIGDGGGGKHCNNQEIVGVAGVDGKVYQYTQLDAALAEFQTAYAQARSAGKTVAMSWASYASPGSPPPNDNYTSTSYATEQQYLA
ncbi:MAG TPA: hypothetical protein VNF68_11425 [Candidatus Baltobacteraceae bacterium]|nr:hypothetical protein [Candidatus Baltobacteraceae bacterium]